MKLISFLFLFALVCIARPQELDAQEIDTQEVDTQEVDTQEVDTQHEEHHCDHEEHQRANPPEFMDIEEDFEVLDDTEENERLLASKTYPQMRIYANYDNLARTASSSYVSYVKYDLAPPVIAYFHSALRVRYPVSGKLKLSSSVRTLCGMNTPSALKSGVSADYAILFSSRSESTTVVATSKYCYLASGSKRPVVATTNFNRQMFKVAGSDVILHEKNTYLLLHEMMHTFGFSSSMYKYFVSSTGRTISGHVKSMKVGGTTHTVINVPSLTSRIRNFHGCSSIPGAIMEDDGGSGTDGSHFEKKFYIYETMATGSASGKRITELSLAMMEATGWYQVNYAYAEPYFYGQGQGCNFINGKCSSSRSSFDEFCTSSGRKCAFMGHSGGSCYSDTKTDGCKYVNPNNNYHCESAKAINNARLKSAEVYGRGTGSKCFTGSLNTRSSTSSTSFCFKYTCSGSGSSTQLKVILGSRTAICKREGKMSVSGYYGTLDCPDPLTFCRTAGKRYCPRNCMGRGKCVSNKCQCNKGFRGVDCALRA